MTDPIADMLTRIRNAITAKKETVEIPASNMKKAIAEILLSEGYVKDVKIVEDCDHAQIQRQKIGYQRSSKEVQARSSRVFGGRGYAQSSGRARHGDSFHQ